MPVDFSQFQACTTAACSTEMIAAFHLNQPIWDSAVVFDEPVLPASEPSALWRKPTAILVVSNRQTGMAFEKGRDYALQDGKLEIPAGSHIPTYPGFQYAKLPGVPEMWQSVTKAGDPLRIESTYQLHQIAVTYLAGEVAKKPIKAGGLPYTWGKIADRKPVAVTFYGDSIIEGSDSTKAINVAPHQPGWVDLTAALLSNGGDGKYYWRNLGVGGWSTNEGLPNIKKKTGKTSSDLFVIGLGMNDTAAQIAPENYEDNIRKMIQAERAKSQKTEFLLVSSWLGNKEWKPMNTARLFAYRKAMLKIAQDTRGVAMADMTELSKNILSKKSYYDVTANGVNHPSDWIYVGYAQVVADVIRNR
ncbi:SGNH/GDSL hydrolase family protein [Janthinobacterium rivuli]|uniref:SGNH/GDSL hydrolase family protein n=1 Tax=Janthinobacterium rivuli TaxID=2751478 RepID=UPI00383B8098